MNILLLAPQPFFQERGTPLAVRMIAQVLGAIGHRVDLLVYHEGEDASIPGVRLHRTRRLPGVRDIRPGPSVKKIFCDAAMLDAALGMAMHRRYDLVHAVEESVFIAMMLRLFMGVPYIYDMDSSLAEQTADKWRLPGVLTRALEAMERRAVRGSAGVIAVCRSLEARARRYDDGKPVLRLEDVSLLETGGPRPHLRNTLGITGPIVMYVGNLESYQGIDLLLECFALARSRVPLAHLVVIGGVTESIERYRRRAVELGIGTGASFLGPRPVRDLAGYLGEADVLVSPRTQGGNTPMKIYSYLASGTAVLATRLPTHTQVLDDSIAMLAAPTAGAMADALVGLLTDDALRRSLGERARERAASEYSPDAFRKKLADFYARIAQDLYPARHPATRGTARA